jgi:hypothetical protein
MIIGGKLTPHHFGWRAVSGEARYVAFYCRGLRCQPIPGSQQQDIRERRRGKL